MGISKFVKNKNGMTLIELLGTVVILVMLIALAFPILFNGMTTVRDIQMETTLRDEADYLMSSIFVELYTTKESDIEQKNFPASGTNSYYITKNNGRKTGFINNELIISNQIISTSNSMISLQPSKISAGNNGTYIVELNLQYEGRRSFKMKFINEIRTINDGLTKDDEF